MIPFFLTHRRLGEVPPNTSRTILRQQPTPTHSTGDAGTRDSLGASPRRLAVGQTASCGGRRLDHGGGHRHSLSRSRGHRLQRAIAAVRRTGRRHDAVRRGCLLPVDWCDEQLPGCARRSPGSARDSARHARCCRRVRHGRCNPRNHVHDHVCVAGSFGPVHGPLLPGRRTLSALQSVPLHPLSGRGWILRRHRLGAVTGRAFGDERDGSGLADAFQISRARHGVEVGGRARPTVFSWRSS